jgi:hypothetical protein
MDLVDLVSLQISRIWGIENRKPNIFFLSFPVGNNYPKNIFYFIFICIFRASALRLRGCAQVRANASTRPRGRNGASERARGARGRGKEPGTGKELIHGYTTHVRSDTARICADAPLRPRKRVGSVWTQLASARLHARIRADSAIYPGGNFITDAIVRLSHRRPSSHRPRPRPSVHLSA